MTASPKMNMMEVACPVCAGTGHRQVCRSRDYVYSVPGEFRYVRCERCGHIFMNPRPSDDALLACYPPGYGPHGGDSQADFARGADGEPAGAVEGRAGGERPSVLGRLRKWAVRVTGMRRVLCWVFDEHATILPMPRVPGESRLLEIGCASGGYLQRAAKVGWIVDGIEPSPAAATHAAERGIPVFVGRLDEADLEPQSRDAVVAWMVLEHVPDPIAFLSAARGALTPRGVLAISIPNARSAERWLFGRFWQGYDPPRHLQVFSAREIRRILEQRGFVDVRVIYQAGVRDTYAGLAAWGAERFPGARWPRELMRIFRTDTPAWLRWISLLPAHALALTGLAGRITVVATKDGFETPPVRFDAVLARDQFSTGPAE